MTIPFDPNSTKFPSRKELPDIPGAPKGAAWVWGEDDYVSWLKKRPPPDSWLISLADWTPQLAYPYQSESGRRSTDQKRRDGLNEVSH
jgi:hypothetical protein